MAMVLVLTSTCLAFGAARGAAETVQGWRRDGRGLYPEAKAPVTWSREVVDPVVRGATWQGHKPGTELPTPKDPEAAPKPFRWIAIGPFPTTEGDGKLDQDYLNGEANLEPTVNDKVGDLAWKPFSLGFGTLRSLLKGTKNKICYMHAYFEAKREGEATLQIQYPGGLKVYLNGEEVHKGTKGAGGGQNVRNAMRGQDHRRYNRPGASPRIKIQVKKGWNRIMVKSYAGNSERNRTVKILLTEREGLPYKTKNMRWATRLPDWGTNSPIIVNDRIFVSSEPDILVCLDKKTGKILWQKSTPIYAAVTEEERKKHPELLKIDPLAKELEDPKTDAAKKVKLRKQIQAILHSVNFNHFAWPTSKGLPSHGFTFPTPVSDGKHVYVFYTNSIAACYDMDGNRKWIRNMIKELTMVPTGKGRANVSFNISAPLLTGNKLILLRNYMAALDKNTGEMLWKAPELHGHSVDKYHDRKELKMRYNANFSDTPTLCTIGGEEVVVGGKAAVVRVSDGRLLLQGNKSVQKVRAGWAWDGKNQIWFTGHGGGARVLQFAGKPDAIKITSCADASNAKRWPWSTRTAMSSPLCHDGLVYVISQEGLLTVGDAEKKVVLYQEKLPLRPQGKTSTDWTHGCCSCPTLGGEHIYIMDNQLNTVVIKPGRKYEQVAVNRIDNLLPRMHPTWWQDSAMTNPVFDEESMYIRGERDLFCIAKVTED